MKIVPFMSVFFGGLPEPREERKREHLLLDVVVISILAVFCGADGWQDIEDWAKAWEPWLRKHLRLRRGIPCRDTYRRVFTALDPKAFNACFVSWTRSLLGGTEGKIMPIDGKTLRGSFKLRGKKGKKGAIHLVSAWVCENRVVFGQIATRSKSNEITAIPELLELLDIRGATVTIDAMGCQKKIVAKIIERQGDYVIAVKDNQPTLHAQIEEAFVTADVTDEPIGPKGSFESSETGHGRHEVRKVRVLDADGWLDVDQLWPGLRSIVRVESERTIAGETSYETRYYISSHAPDAPFMATCIRAHWQIENQQHWTLDVGFNEDSSRIRSRNAPENFAMLRRIAINLMRTAAVDKKSVKRRRFVASMSPRYLEQVLQSIGGHPSASLV